MFKVKLSGTLESVTKLVDFYWSPETIPSGVDFPYILSGIKFRLPSNSMDWVRPLDSSSATSPETFSKDEYKYVTYESDDDGKITLLTVIFDKEIFHSDMSDVIEELNFETCSDYTPVSAGFFSPKSGLCYGLSDSLGLKCNPTVDNQQLNKIISQIK